MSDEPLGEPYDEIAVRRDEAALDALGEPRDALVWDDDDVDPADQDAVLRLLRALRDDISTGAELAGAAVVPLRGRRRLGARGVAVAAVTAVVLSAGGVAAASVGAPPGSLLYPIREVVTGHHAPDAGLVALGRLLDNAEKALDHGRLTAARAQLDAAQRRAAAVPSGRLSKADSATFGDDQARLALLEDRLATAEAAGAASTAPGKSGQAPGHLGTAPGKSKGDGKPPAKPHPSPRGQASTHATHPPAGSVTPSGRSSHRPQPVIRGSSSSAASRTPSANPRA